jgi:FtsZ-interacting cell division protein YlmF
MLIAIVEVVQVAVDVSQQTAFIRQAIKGGDVRESLAGGIEKIAGDVNQFETNINNKQDTVEQGFSDMQQSEVERRENENTRQNDESTRQTNETARQNAEAERATNENIRQSNEATRQNNENSRIEAENNRVSGYLAMIDTSQMILKNPVATYDDIVTIYPTPQKFWTVRVLDTGKLYRYDGTEWVWIDTLNTTVYDALVAQLDTSLRQQMFPNTIDLNGLTIGNFILPRNPVLLGNVTLA